MADRRSFLGSLVGVAGTALTMPIIIHKPTVLSGEIIDARQPDQAPTKLVLPDKANELLAITSDLPGSAAIEMKGYAWSVSISHSISDINFAGDGFEPFVLNTPRVTATIEVVVDEVSINTVRNLMMHGRRARILTEPL